MRVNDPIWFEPVSGDAALVVALLDHLAALSVARPGQALTDEQRLFLADTRALATRTKWLKPLSRVASAIKAQLPADTH